MPHGHDHHHHAHDPGHGHGSLGARALIAALAVTAVYAVIELVSGWWFGSLALMSDAGHMFSDSAALGIAALAAWIARRPAGARHSYGLSRAEVVAAFVNSLALLVVVVIICVEAVQRLLDPQPVSGLGVALVASVGLVINLGVIYLLGHGGHDMNTRAATLHVFGDLLGSVAALTAGAVIYFTGWNPVDPLLSIAIAILILISTLRLLREALHVLMEGVPAGIRLPEVGAALARLPGVKSVHDLHVWSISSGQLALSAHVDVDELRQWPVILEQARRLVQERFSIGHVTLQPEVSGGINSNLQPMVRIVPRDD
jgi:cobalt-zinc-cadmium efflux system protein